MLSFKLILSAPANHFKGIESVGGNLHLYEDRLQFQSHGFNIQNQMTMIPLEQIAEVGFYNTLGLIPNGLKVITKEGKTEKFVIGKRKIWKETIDKQIQQL